MECHELQPLCFHDIQAFHCHAVFSNHAALGNGNNRPVPPAIACPHKLPGTENPVSHPMGKNASSQCQQCSNRSQIKSQAMFVIQRLASRHEGCEDW